MEIWKKINNYEHYEVSNLGNIRSLTRKIVNNKGFTIKLGRLLKPIKHTGDISI